VIFQKTDVKKKFESRYGQISISIIHPWSVGVNGFQISPYFQELQAYAGQDDNFNMAAQRLEKYLRIACSSSQVDRVVKEYGAQLEEQGQLIRESDYKEHSDRVAQLGEEAKAYVMMDGCMLLTRQESEWKEMKLARIFNSDQHYELSDKRNWIRDSLYLAHFGSYKDFLTKLEPLVDEYEKLGDRLVFVNDGAKWIWNWVAEHYPSSTQILDYYHAVEYLGDFAKVILPDKKARNEWVNRQKMFLLNDQVEQVIDIVRAIQCNTNTKQEAQHKLLTYYGNNKGRMKYKTYRAKGLLIGSGPIESAHRTVIQKRLKQSGQRWTIKGAQLVANLRVANMSGLWHKVIKLIKMAA